MFIYLRWDGLAPGHMLKEEKLDIGERKGDGTNNPCGGWDRGVLSSEVVYLLSPPSLCTLER